MVIAAARDTKNGPEGWDERDRADYAARNIEFPLLSLRDEEGLEGALAQINALLDRDELSAGSAGYLDALTDLVSVYEDRTVPFPRLSGRAILRHLMEERGLRQQDLVGVLGSKSVVSEVLNGHRNFSLAHLKKLSRFFGLPVDVFIGPPETTGEESPTGA